MNLKDAEDYEFSEQDMYKPLKNITLSEADSTETFKFKPFEYERGVVTKTAQGVIDTIRDMQDLPEQVKIFGKRISFGFGGYFGDTPEETERKKLNLITAERNLNEAQAERYRFSSQKETESLAYGVGGGIVNYGTMLIPAGAVGGGLKAIGKGAKAVSAGAEAAGLGTMGVMELAGQVQDKTPTTPEGDIDIEAMTPEWARKATGGTIAYTSISAVTEKFVGFGKQVKMWSKPIKWGNDITSKSLTLLREAGKNALSEGMTEGIQDLEAIGISLLDGTLEMDKLPARLQQAWKSAIIGGIIGGGVGTAAAMKSARNVKKQLREIFAPVIGEQDAQEAAEKMYDSGTNDMTTAISIELEISSELRNKHGKVWNSMLAAVSREIEGKPRFEAMTEDEKASYANTVAKHFADNILAEAHVRGVTLDSILTASDITWDNGIRIARKINIFDAIKNPEMIPPEAKQKRESLLAFIKRSGGIQDIGGDVKNMGALKQYPGLINKNGITLDDMALSAWENGYFPEFSERPDINTLLEAIDEGLRGNHRYNEEEAQTFTDVIENYKQELDREGIDWENMTAAEIEQAVDEIPDMKSLMREAEFYEQNDFDFEYAATGMNEDERGSYLERIAMQMYQLTAQEEENFTDMYVSEGKKGVLDWIDRQIEYYRNAVDDAVNEEAKKYFRKMRDEKIAWLKDVEDFVNKLDKPEDTFYRSVENVNELNVGDFIAGMGEVTDKTENQVKIKDNWYANSIIDRMISQGQINLTNKPKEKEKITDKEIEKKAKKYFGTTTNLAEAGYILSDGSLLDFSGKKEGGQAGTRSYDHREITGAFEDDDIGMEEFVNNGAIRYMPESNSLYIANMPTPQQFKAISNIVDRANGEINLELVKDAKNMGVSSRAFFKEFDSGTSIKNIKNAINAYYSGNLSKLQTFFQTAQSPKGMTTVTPDAYIIKLLEGADESTLPHELAHYWLSEMWNYVRSGRASEKYMQRWDNIAKYLNIRPEQTRLTPTQQEKFASSYESYITKGNLPTPLIGSAFDDYDKWLQRVYNDYNKINYHVKKGKKVYSHPVRLTDAAVKFFQSMTTGTLEAPTLAPKDTGVSLEEKPVEAKEVIEPKNEIVAEPTISDTTLVTNGDKGVSKVYKRGALLHPEAVSQPGLAYDKMHLDEQALAAKEFVENDLNKAREFIGGEKNETGKLSRTAVMLAYENEMLRIGNLDEYDRVRKINAYESVRHGQEIAAQRIETDDVTNPTYWLEKAEQNLANQVAEKLFKGKEKLKQLNDTIKEETDKLYEKIKGKTVEEQQKIMRETAEKLQKEYGLETLYQMPDEINHHQLNSFIKSVFGINLERETRNDIINKSEQVRKLWKNTMEKGGNPSVEAMRAKRELNDLINSKTPSNALAVWTSNFGRSAMLLSVKSPNLNIISNTVTGFTESIVRRLSLGTTEKAVDKSVKQEFSKYAWEVYKASSDIVTTMNDYDDDMRIIGEQIIHSQGQGRFRAASRKIEEVSFKYLMGAPDVFYKTLAFNDTADLLATKIAREEGAKDISKRATEIYKDAILIRPQTEQGKKVRKQAQEEAHYTTFTNDSWAAKFGLSARKWLNMVGRDKVRLGDITMKFVKTPANVSMVGLEYGFGLLYTAYNIQEIIKHPQSITSQRSIKAAFRNGLGIALTLLIYSMLDPDDYFSEFDTLNPKEKDRMKALNAMPNSIKIGNKWVSLDYFGQLAIPLVGMLEAKRNNGLRSYIQSGFTQAAKIPGIKETKQLIDSMSEYARYDLPAEKIVQMMAGTVLDQARAMTIPAIVNDIAKMTDDYERDALGGVMDKFMASIPGLRQKLPERYGLQGMIRTEPALSTLFFGSRVKTGTEDKLIREVGKLSGKGEQPSISDVTKYGDLRLLSPEKKVRVRKEFYKQYNAETKKLISTRDYQNKSPEAKKKALNKVRSNVVKSLKQKYSNDIQREKRRR